MDRPGHKKVVLRYRVRSENRKKLMATAKISSKYQVVIPKAVRERAGIRSGQSVEVLLKDGIICLVPDRPLEELRGLLRGVATDGYRDKEDRA